jgi:hypothetical protein
MFAKVSLTAVWVASLCFAFLMAIILPNIWGLLVTGIFAYSLAKCESIMIRDLTKAQGEDYFDE